MKVLAIMPSPMVITALREAARKRRLFDAHTERLLADALPAAQEGFDALRAWLAGQDRGKHLVPVLGHEAGSLVGGYQLLAHLADGGMGSVWMGMDAVGQLVVLKRIRPDRVHADMILRFEREARIVSELRHANVVQALSWGRDADGNPFLAMEFVPGGDLHGILRTRGRLDTAHTLTLMRQLALSLGAAHAKAIIHRDIKPSNIFITPEGDAKLADFGLARSVSDDRTKMTEPGHFIGSPLYVAPEQADPSGPELDIRCDLYALGCVAFHCLAGCTPFSGGLTEVLHHHIHKPPPDLGSLVPGLCTQVVSLVMRLLSKDRDQRHASPDELSHDLETIMTGMGIPIPSAPAPECTPTLPYGTDAPSPSQGPLSDLMISVDPDRPAPDPHDITVAMVSAASTDRTSTLAQIEGPPISGCLGLRSATGQGPVIILWPQDSLQMGKLRGAPVDLCLRNYPVEMHQERCNKLSRYQLRLWVDSSGAHVQDLGSLNGSQLDGNRLHTDHPADLFPSRVHDLILAGVVHLRLHVRPASVGSGIDAIIINRPMNRPDLLYALVPGKIIIGGPRSDFVLPDDAGPGYELEVRHHAWWWRYDEKSDTDWRPLVADMRLQLGVVSWDVHHADVSWMD